MPSIPEQRLKKKPINPVEPPQTVVPEPWKSTIQHVIHGPLSKTDMYSCLSFYKRPQSWIFFVVSRGGSLPLVLNLELHRHVVFAIMLDYWVVVHVDLVTLNAAYMDPSSATSTTYNQLMEMLVHWLKGHLGDENMGQKLKLFEKECEQGNDTAMLAISNINALARGYACAEDTDPLSLRSDLVHKMKALRQSNKPSKRLNQWTTIYGLRTADSLFSFGMPPPKPPKSDTTESKKTSSDLSLYMICPPVPTTSKKSKTSTQARPVAPSDLGTPFAPVPSMPSSNKRTPTPPTATSDLRNLFGVSPSSASTNTRTPSPPVAPSNNLTPSLPTVTVTRSNKRKAGASSTVTDVPAKRRQVAEPPKEETSAWCFSTWWGKKKDLDVARESMGRLQEELEKARANVQDIKHEIRVLEKRK